MTDRDNKEIAGLVWRKFGKINDIFWIWEQKIGKDRYRFSEGCHGLLIEACRLNKQEG